MSSTCFELEDSSSGSMGQLYIQLWYGTICTVP